MLSNSKLTVIKCNSTELKQSRTQCSAHQKEAHLSERMWRYLPLEGLVDTLRSICMSIMPAENPISALRLSGAVELNIVERQNIENCLSLLQNK